MAGPGRSSLRWTSFGTWTLVGAGVGLGLLSILSIGVFVLAASALGTVAVARWRGASADAVGIVAGLGLPPLYVAFLNRHGPGTDCTSIPGGSACTDLSSPWPWFAAGSVLLAAGVTAVVTMRRRGADRSLSAAG